MTARSWLNGLAILASALLVGSIFFFGIGVAPIVFADGMLPSRTIAGELNGAIIHRLMLVTCALSVFVLGLFGYLRFSRPTIGTSWSVGLALIAALILFYCGVILLPDVNSLRLEIGSFDNLLDSKAAARAEFDSLHSRFSLLIRIAFVASALSLLLHSVATTLRSKSVNS